MLSIRFVRRPGAAVAVLLGGLCLGGPAIADDPAPIDVTIKDHRFVPSEIHVPMGKRMVLVVRNEDTTPEEFELDGVTDRESDRRRHLRNDPTASPRAGALPFHG